MDKPPATGEQSLGSGEDSTKQLEPSSEESDLFVERPPDDFFCPVTKGLLLQPHRTECCGNRLSREAATRIRNERKACPICREFNWSTVLDRHLQHLVQALLVFCHYKTSGCEWQGEIIGLLPHVLANHEEKFSVPFINAIGNTEFPEDVINLMQAVYSVDKEEVKLLLSKRADPNPLMIEFSPLMQASKVGSVEIARLLLAAGANPNLANDEGQTALIIAATHGHCDVAELLLEKGANPDMQNNDRWTALMAAVYSNHNNIALKLIEAGATPHIQDKNYTNALLLAVDKESEEVLNALLDHVDLRFPFQLDIQDSRGDTTLITACRKRNLKLVRRLLSMKANPNISNFNGETPIIIARKLDEKGILQELLDNHKLSPLETELKEAAPLSALRILEGDNIKVSGAPLLKKQSFVYTGRKMAFYWEDAGINLHFPAAACEEEIKISVKVLTNVEDNCIMPDGYRLMPFASAVYKITASAKLSAPVKVRMQHCAVVDKKDSLVHIVAHCTPPYRFKLLHKGKFPLGDSYGEIEISRFSVLGIICNTLGLVFTLAIHVVYFRDGTAHIAVTKNIPANRTAIREEHPNATFDEYTTACPWLTTDITFSEAEPPNQEGWRIKMEPYPSKLNIHSILSYERGCVIPKIELEPEWIKDDEQPKEKKVFIRVEGGNVKSIALSCKPPEQPQDQPQLPLHQLQEQPANEYHPPAQGQQPLNEPHPNLNDCQPKRSATPTLPLLQRFPKLSSDCINIVERIATKHHQLGISILKDDTGAVNDAIEAHYGPDQNRITKAILQKWLEGTGRTPQSWATLITVLREIGLNVLAQEIEENLRGE